MSVSSLNQASKIVIRGHDGVGHLLVPPFSLPWFLVNMLQEVKYFSSWQMWTFPFSAILHFFNQLIHPSFIFIVIFLYVLYFPMKYSKRVYFNIRTGLFNILFKNQYSEKSDLAFETLKPAAFEYFMSHCLSYLFLSLLFSIILKSSFFLIHWFFS